MSTIGAKNIKSKPKSKSKSNLQKDETLNGEGEMVVDKPNEGSDEKELENSTKKLSLAFESGMDNNSNSNSNSNSDKPRFVCRLKGLPWSARENEIREFFKEEQIIDIQIVFLRDGKASGMTGEAFVEFATLDDLQSACLKNRRHLGHRYIEIFKASGGEIDIAAKRIVPTPFRSPKSEHIVRLRGLPYESTENDIRKFFAPLKTVDVHLVKDDLGRPSGEGFVEFSSDEDVTNAMSKHRQSLGRRYIELFRSGRDELMKVLGFGYRNAYGHKKFNNHSYRNNDHIDESNSSTCLLMRGLPYSSTEIDITKFFQEINVTPVRIHRKADGGEAYVEFYSSTDCSKAMTRHKSFIGQRYIELFRVTYEAMAQTVGLPSSQQRSSNSTNNKNGTHYQ